MLSIAALAAFSFGAFAFGGLGLGYAARVMERAPDIDAFVAQRFGRYVVGRHFLAWCTDPTLGGLVFWGVPDEGDVEDLGRVFTIDPQPGIDRSYDIVTDGQRVERVSSAAFDPFAQKAVPRLVQQLPLVRRNAMVAPPGMVGAVMAGFFGIFGLPGAHRVFSDARAAFTWIDRLDAFDEVEQIVNRLLGEAQVVAELRRWLVDHLRDATVESGARALARSVRSLQRELGAASTSFTRELERARVDVARRLLVENDDKLEGIAREVGCVSASTFSELFRRVAGETPSAYRARLRG